MKPESPASFSPVTPDLPVAVLSVAADPLVLLDEFGRIVGANPGAAALLGAAGSLAGRLLADCLGSAGAPDLATRQRLEDGRELVRLAPSRRTAPSDPDLLTNAARFEKIFESVPNIAVQGYRPDGTIRYWNKASEAIYGYTAEEAIGRNLLDLIIPPEMREAVRAAIAHGADTGEMPPASELILRRKDGAPAPVFSSHAVVRGAGQEPELFCLDLDLRDQKRQEQERLRVLADLRDNEERLRLALTGTNQGLFDLNLQTGVATVTPEYTSMLGYDAATYTPTLETWTALLHPDDRDRALGTLQGCLRGEIPGYVIEYRLRTAGGEWMWILSTGRVVAHDATGRPARLIGVHSDITARKRMEEVVRLSEQQFRRIVENVQDAYLQTDLQGRIVRVSPSAAAIYRYESPEAMVGLDTGALYALPADREHVRATLLASGSIADATGLGCRKDGSTFWVSLNARAFRDAQGCVVGFETFVRDISARKQAEDRLGESLKLYEDLVANLPLGVYRVAAREDGDFEFVYVSDRYCEILGLSRAAILADARVADAAVHPEDWPEFDRCNRTALAEHRPFRWEGRVVVRGETRWLRVESNPASAPGLRPIWSGFVVDVTDRRTADQAFEVFRFATDHAADAIYWMRADASFCYVNEQACRALGYSREELLQLSLFEIDPKVTREWWDEAWRKFSAREIARNRLDTQHRRKDGTLIPVEISSTHFWFGDLELHVAYALDISDRQRAETALRESEYFLSRSQTVAQIGSYKFDIAAGTWTATPQLEAIFGVDASYPKSVAGWLQLVMPDDREEMRRHLLEHVLKAHNRFEHEYRIIRPSDGQVRWVFGLGELECDEHDRPVRMIGTIQDVTERRNAEGSRLELERRLLHAQKLESLGVLAGGIAHDFNNLLMAILGNLDLALLDISPVSPARKTIQQSVAAARRAADLTRQMLAYSGRGAFDIRETDLGELVEENAHLFRACISKLVTLQIHAAPHLPRIQADPGQVQQVVMNLITNASEAIGDRAGVVQLRTGVADADAATLGRSRCEEIPPAGRFVYLEVTDTGCGMDLVTQQRLFDPFFTTKFTGRGLGMSAILGIVRGHKGAIFVDSEVGRGTTVRVLFPAGRLPEENTGAAAPGMVLEAAGGAPRGRILVVDDEEVVRHVCKHMLMRHGWTALEASDGHQALAAFRADPAGFDCVLLDLSMPGIGGVEVFRELRRIRPDIRVVLTSGYSNDRRTSTRLADEGLAGFIQKPFTIEALLQTIDRAVAK